MADCERCGHPFDPHRMIATGATPDQGGIMICNRKGCECFSTWSVPQLGSEREDVYVPPAIDIEALREQLQTD